VSANLLIGRGNNPGHPCLSRPAVQAMCARASFKHHPTTKVAIHGDPPFRARPASSVMCS
jgi:hypothetical protein